MSLRLPSTMARNTLRPMRPNPLIPTRNDISGSYSQTSLALSLTRVQFIHRCFGDCLGGNSKTLVKIFYRGAGPEAFHSDEDAIRADESVPPLAHSCLHRDPHGCGTNKRNAFGGRKFEQQVKTRYRDHAGRYAPSGKQFLCRDCNRYFRSGSEDRSLRFPACRRNLIGATAATVGRVQSKPELRQVLAGQGQDARAGFTLDGNLPALDGFDAVAGAKHQHVRDGAQRRQMFDRLMGWAIFAETDRIVRHHMNDTLAHQGGKTDGRAAII